MNPVSPNALVEDDIYYPVEDAEPMGETNLHLRALMFLLQCLERHYHDRQDVSVHGDMFVYYVPGVSQISVAPDIMVLFGVPYQLERKTYKTWLEGVIPSMVIEVVSEGTLTNDMGSKMDKYAEIGVPEYFLVAPEGEFNPSVRGYYLENGLYLSIMPQADGWLWSPTLQLFFQPNQLYGVRLRDAKGNPLLSDTEAEAQAQQQKEAAEARAAEERQQREAAEARALQEQKEKEALAAELAHLRATLAQHQPPAPPPTT